MTQEECIRLHAQNTPDKAAVVCAQDTLTYGQLWTKIEERSARLAAGGLRPGRPYVFINNQDADFIVTYCAVHHLGAIAVPPFVSNVMVY